MRRTHPELRPMRWRTEPLVRIRINAPDLPAPVLHWVAFGPCAGPAGPHGAPLCTGRGTPVLDCMAISGTARIMLCRPCQDARVDAYVAEIANRHAGTWPL